MPKWNFKDIQINQTEIEKGFFDILNGCLFIYLVQMYEV